MNCVGLFALREGTVILDLGIESIKKTSAIKLADVSQYF
jgi:hypothetical protein